MSPPAGSSPINVLTYHDDSMRTGLMPLETVLTLANVKSTTFGKVNSLTTDGKVDAEPLYVSNVTINSVLHNVLYVVTEHASVYAFDADNGAQLWKTTALPQGETTSEAVFGCGQISPEIGITDTPVIDRNRGNGVMYFVAMSKTSNGTYHQRLHAVDITSGAELFGGPVEIQAKYPGTGDNSQNGFVVFDPKFYAERARTPRGGGQDLSGIHLALRSQALYRLDHAVQRSRPNAAFCAECHS